MRCVLIGLSSLLILAGTQSAQAALTPPHYLQVQKSQRILSFGVLPLANLFYQIDCLADQGHCSKAAFQQLWQKELHWNSSDETQLQKWRDLKNKYQRQVFFPPSEPSPLPQRFEGIDLWKKIRIASLNAGDTVELQERLALIMRPQDAAELTALLGYWEPRFNTWWRNGPEASAQKQARALAERLQTPQVSGLLAQAEAFYQAQFQSHTLLNFNIIYRPTGGEKNTHGEQIENHSLIEALPNKSPDDIIDVVVHEFCHYLYQSSTSQEHVQLLKAITKQNNPLDTGAYYLLNEALATAIGNGLIQKQIMSPEQFSRYTQTPLSFYNDPFIDQAAKAILPPLEIALKEKHTLRKDFLSPYLEHLKKNLGSTLLSPQVQLKQMAFLKPPQWQAATGDLYQWLSPRSIWGSAYSQKGLLYQLEKQPDLGLLILLPANQMPLLSPLEAQIPNEVLNTLSQKNTRALYIFKRKAGGMVYILKAEELKDIKFLIKKLSQTQGKGFFNYTPYQLPQP